MLRSLAIRDFTIIDRLELDFGPGFGAITGETGAGKSILIDALSLLLGERADSGLVAEGAERADLTATFELQAGHPARAWLAEQALPDDEPVLMRRMLPAEGSSRAWINGQPVAVAQLRALGALLVEIHGQHEHQRLARGSAPREWLDRQVDPELPRALAEAADDYHARRDDLERLADEAGRPDELELLEFQLRELERLGLERGEFERIELEQRRLASVDELQAGIAAALEALAGEARDGAAALVRRAEQTLEPLTDRAGELTEAGEMLASAAVNLEETVRLLQRIGDGLEHDPQRLEQVEQRMARATELARRHHVEPDALPALAAELAQRKARIDGLAERRDELQAALDEAEQRWRERADRLHAARAATGAEIAARTAEALAELGMDQARVEFRVTHDPEARVSRHGADDVEILFSANPGQSPRPLARIASGGELSRFSLALIIASAEDATGMTRIFDEIDAGVGGETAGAVGRFLGRAGRGGQALCVTHLAQVAACADRQWQVIKRAEAGATRVGVEALEGEKRVRELARMLGSARATTSLEHARALLGHHDQATSRS